MGFFKDIGKSLEKTVKAVVKDAVPITAGVLTGGASLSVLKPTALLERIDKATGLPVSAIANSLNPNGAGVTESQTVIEQQSVAPPFAPQSNQSVYDQITPYLNSFMQATQKSSSDIMPNANTIVTQQAPASSNKMLFIFGGIGSLLALFFLMKGKK